MTAKTAFRITSLTFLLIVGALTFNKISQTIQAKENIQHGTNSQNEVVTTTTDSAQTETTETEETLEETTERNIKQVKKYLDLEKVKGVLSNHPTHHGIVGEVQRLNDDALTFENTQGKTILAINEDEVDITKKGAAQKLSDIAVGNWVTVLGYQEAEDFTPRIIFVDTTSPRPDTQLVALGMITDISSKTVSITDRATNEERVLTLTKNSDIEDSDGEKASIDDFDVDINVLIVATTADGEKDFKIKTMRSLVPLDDLN